MSLTLTNTIHVRDFVDEVVQHADGNNVEIRTDIHIFREDGFHSPKVIVEPIRTRIRTYLTPQDRELYVPNTFYFADGRFTTAMTSDNTLEIVVQAFSLKRYVVLNLTRSLTLWDYPYLTIPLRHPGNVSDFDEYRSHLPEQWCPMVTMTGTVGTGGDEEPLDEPRHFELRNTVYDSSKAAPVQFPAVCFFQNNKRWEKVKVPASGSLVIVTGKVVGRTEANCLALRLFDIAYLSKATSTAATTPGPASTTPTLKRSHRWDGRVDFSTPSKKMRTSEPVAETSEPVAESSEPVAETGSVHDWKNLTLLPNFLNRLLTAQFDRRQNSICERNSGRDTRLREWLESATAAKL